jgi:hypothetical protein
MKNILIKTRGVVFAPNFPLFEFWRSQLHVHRFRT